MFFASVNERQFLVDETGNRRWWTVPVTAINYTHTIDMQQMWAEVFTWFQAGERWWLSRDEEEMLNLANEDHQQGDPIEELILSRYDRAQPAVRLLTATEVLIELGYEKPNKAQQNKAGSSLRKHFGDSTPNNGRKVFRMPPLIRRVDPGTQGWNLPPERGWSPAGHHRPESWSLEPGLEPGLDPEERPY